MKKLVVEVENLESVTWPAKCSGCGQDTTSATTNRYDVKVVKAINAMFSAETPKTLSVKVCEKCSRKIAGFKKLSNVGWGVVILAIASPFLIGAIFKQTMTSQEILGCFLSGAFLQSIGKSRQKIVSGVRCMRKSKNRWVFWFRNENFASAFARMNSASLIKTNI